MQSPGLTEQELALASTATFDLGSGYPQIEAPESVRRLFRDDRLEDLGLMTVPAWTADKQALVDADLSDSVQGMLGFRPIDCKLRPTFSGSLAVDRAITACLRRSRQLGYDRMEVVTTSPSIDIMRDLLGERSDIVTVFSECSSGSRFPMLNLDRLLSLVDCSPPQGASRAVLLTSPENPTGQVWSREDLRTIALVCNARGIPLVVDHCFYLAGVHERVPAAVWSLDDAVEHWIGIWDTGKTFGLCGDKLGFLLGSHAMMQHVDDALRVLQFDVSRRQKLFFTELLRMAPFFDYVPSLRNTCQSNLRELGTFASEHGFTCLSPPAGSLALIDIQELGLGDAAFQKVLLESGVGLVTGSPFFHGSLRRSGLMRVALARSPAMFQQALEVMDGVLATRSEHRAAAESEV